MIGNFSPYVVKTTGNKLRLYCRYEDTLTGKIKTASVALPKDTKKAKNIAEIELRKRIEKKKAMPDKEGLTLDELVEAYAQNLASDPDVTPSTRKRNTIAVKSMARIIGGDILVSRLDSVDILGRLTATGESAGTKNERMKRFETLVRWGFRHNYIESTEFLEKLTRFKDIPHKEKISDKFLEGYEYRKMRDAMKLEKYRLFFCFQCQTGCRTGEALALQKSDIDIVNRTISINKSYDSNEKVLTNTKTSSSIRQIYIQDELLELLHEIDVFYKRQDMRNGIRSSLLFHAEDGSYFSYYAFRKYLARISETTIGRKVVPHALRHTHASLLFEQGFTIDEVQERLGHEDSNITRKIYIHITQALKQKRNEKMNKFRIG